MLIYAFICSGWADRVFFLEGVGGGVGCGRLFVFQKLRQTENFRALM